MGTKGVLMEFYRSSAGVDIPILDHGTGEGRDMAHPAGATYGHDPSQVVREMFAPPGEMELVPESEWDARFDEQEQRKSSLEHLYLRGGKPAFENLDQNGHGYCWAYSVCHAVMLCRLRDNMPLVRLNPHSVAAIIKGGRDEGGWCGLSAKFVAEHGCAEEGGGPGQWPLHSRSLKHDTPECRARMALYKTGEEWRDLGRKEWDQQLSVRQLATCGFNCWPGAVDYDEWGHSIAFVRWVRVERGRWSPLILNSWAGWGRHGLAVISGNWSHDGAIAVRTVRAT